MELENVQLEYDVIEFLNLNWTKFDSLVDLDKLEETLNEDEKILDSMEAQMNVLIRKNRESILPNSKVTILGNPLINGQLNPQSAQKINRPSHRKPRQLEIPKIVELRRLDVKNLFFESVNGVPADELVFVKNGTISFPLENLIVTNLKAKNVELSNDGTVNGMDVSKSAVNMEAGNFPANLNIPDIVVARNFETKEINNFIVEQQNIIPKEIFEDGVELLPNITSNTIRITGNLKAERINGVPWKEFVLKTVRKNVAQTLDFIEVNGVSSSL